jgi:hypothetical protein
MVAEQSNKLDEIHIKKDFDVAAALEAIRFWWTLARSKGENLVCEIWKEPPKQEEKGG